MVLSCVGQLTSCAASGDSKRICCSQCGSSLRWYAYQPETFCFVVGAHVKRMLLSVEFVSIANGQYAFRRALRDEQPRAIVLHDDRDATPFKVERYLINLVELFFDLELPLEFHMLEHCNIEQVLETGLVEAVQIGVFQNAAGSSPCDPLG